VHHPDLAAGHSGAGEHAAGRLDGFGQAGEVDATAHQKAEIDLGPRQAGPRDGILERPQPRTHRPVFATARTDHVRIEKWLQKSLRLGKAQFG
jgi:hypothetical protein